MVFDIGVEESKSNTSLVTNERKFYKSKTPIIKDLNEKLTETSDSNKAISLTCKGSAKTPEQDESCGSMTIRPATSDIVKEKRSIEKLDKTKSETCLGSRKSVNDPNKESAAEISNSEQLSTTVRERRNGDAEDLKKSPEVTKSSETTCRSESGRASSTSKIGKCRTDAWHKRPSEIPKLKSLTKTSLGSHQKLTTFQSKLPIKTTEKEVERKQSEITYDNFKNKTDSLKTGIKTCKGKKESKATEKIKQAMAEDFNYLMPLYEKEFKRISDIWVNTIYCSLTMRTNLVKLLFQAFPNINKSQFYIEDERLLHCIAHTKSCTKLEAENLAKFIKTLVASREKTKEDYSILTENKEIAESYNNDWRKLIKKVTDLGGEAKQLQMETPELQKKKEANEINTNEKIRRMEINLCKKEDEIKKLVNQLNVLKQKENAYKENVLLKIPDYKEIKADVLSLISIQKEFDDLRAKYMFQNYTYEKKIKDLEILLEEKRKILEKERDIKKQLQTLLNQLQAHQKRLTTTIGKEQVDYVMGRSFQERGKRREQLWSAAVKLVLRGFLIQMKKLERDRNKMLLELQANDLENLTDLVSIIQKDNFIKSIKQQMNDLQKVCNCSTIKGAQG